MKLLLLSVAITFVLMLGYLLVAGVVVVVSSPDQNNLNPSAIAMVDVPFRLPKIAYYYFFPPSAQDFSTDPNQIGVRKGILATGFFVANLLMYSVPVYLLLRLFVGRRKKRSDKVGKPPPPPEF